jgi:hypothetical protein
MLTLEKFWAMGKNTCFFKGVTFFWLKAITHNFFNMEANFMKFFVLMLIFKTRCA